MNPTIRKIALSALMLSVMGGVAACHTVEGAGKDVEQAGKEIQKTSEDARNHD